jgi:hypothetical protein
LDGYYQIIEVRRVNGSGRLSETAAAIVFGEGVRESLEGRTVDGAWDPEKLCFYRFAFLIPFYTARQPYLRLHFAPYFEAFGDDHYPRCEKFWNKIRYTSQIYNRFPNDNI